MEPARKPRLPRDHATEAPSASLRRRGLGQARSGGGASFWAERPRPSSASLQPRAVPTATAAWLDPSAPVPRAPVPAKWSSQPGRGAASARVPATSSTLLSTPHTDWG